MERTEGQLNEAFWCIDTAKEKIAEAVKYGEPVENIREELNAYLDYLKQRGK